MLKESSLSTRKRPSTTTGSMLYLTGVLLLTSTMLSGPPGRQKATTSSRAESGEKIRTVFVENMSNPKLLAQLSKDAGVTVGPALYVDALSAVGGPADSYLKLMRHNVTQLALGMRAN